MVVLFPHPSLGAKIGRADQLLQRIGNRHRVLHIRRTDHRLLRRLDERPVIDRRLVAEFLDRKIGQRLAVMANEEALGRRGLADDREIESPLAEDVLGFLFLLGLEHHEHALLAFRKHHLVTAHAGLARRHFFQIERDAEIALGAHLDCRAGQTCRAHILDRDHAALLHDLETRLEQQLLCERIADLHGRPLFLGIVVEFRRRHRGAVDAVAPGL